MEPVAHIEAPAVELHASLLTGQVVEITVSGELDEWSREELRVHLLDGAHGDRAGVLLDISALETIEPAGIALLMLARLEIEARGGTFVVLTSPSRVSRVLRRAGISRFVRIAHSREEALQALGPPALAAA